VELARVIAGAVETSKPIIEQRRHTLRVDLPSEDIFLDADLVRLSQVFSNLLDNAAKYTEPGGKIELSATLKNGHVVIAVHDNGMTRCCRTSLICSCRPTSRRNAPAAGWVSA
jgi:signal transduction histidine kinase